VGIRIGDKVGRVDLADNRISGVATEIMDRRNKA
jgi:hypothetical protein